MMIRKMQLDDLPQVASIEQSLLVMRGRKKLFGIRLSRKRLILSLL